MRGVWSVPFQLFFSWLKVSATFFHSCNCLGCSKDALLWCFCFILWMLLGCSCGCVFVSSTSFFSIQLSCDSSTMVFFHSTLCCCIHLAHHVFMLGWNLWSVFFFHGFLSALRVLPRCVCFISQTLRMFLLFCFCFINFIIQLFLCIIFTFFLTFIVRFSNNGTSLSFFHCSTFVAQNRSLPPRTLVSFSLIFCVCWFLL